MDEVTLGHLAGLKGLLVVAFAWLYQWGGREWRPDNTPEFLHGLIGKQKVLRRFVGGLLISLGTLAFSAFLGSYQHWYWLAVLFYPAALTMGYGGDSPGEKFWRRLVYGLAVGACSLVFGVVLGGKMLYLSYYQIALSVSASLFFGLLNPLQAADEETVIATLSVLLAPFFAVYVS